MWNAKEIIKVFRAERAAILREWLVQVRARLWHLDPNLTTRKGDITLCASRTLDNLTDYYVDRYTLDERDLPVPRLPRRSAALWIALPVVWSDRKAMQEMLAEEMQAALRRHDADAETCTLHHALMQAIIVESASAQIETVAAELAAQREESTMSRYMDERFLGNASHELRTPLTAIIGFAELLIEDTYGDLNDGQREAVHHIENSGRNLLEIVNNMLDMLHVRTGKLKLQYHPVKISTVLTSLYNILAPLAHRRNVVFTLKIDSEPGVLEADENILRHILYYLLSSSIRATPAQGEVNFGAVRTAEHLILQTEDTALHLPPQVYENASVAFPRHENVPVRGFEGWEVGLPMVRRYAEMHGGTLHIENQPVRGTTFRVYLPLTRQPSAG